MLAKQVADAVPLVTHLGLGDAILQAGMAVRLLDKYDEIGFPCYARYYASVKSFFVDHPRIKVYTLEHRKGWDWGSPPESAYEQAIARAGMSSRNQIRAGVYNKAGIWTDFSKSFYDHCGVDYRHRWDSCPIPEAAQYVPQLSWLNGTPRIFVHDDPVRFYHITKLKEKEDAFYPDADGVMLSILRYATMIQAAAKVCCIDSSFFHFADCFKLQGKAELHQYVRWPRPREFRYENRNHWEYIT